MNFFYYESKFKIIFGGRGIGGRGARLSNFFLQRIQIFFFFLGGGGVGFRGGC